MRPPVLRMKWEVVRGAAGMRGDATIGSKPVNPSGKQTQRRGGR